MTTKAARFQKELEELKASELGNTEITVFPSVKQTKNPQYIPLWYVIGRIKGSKENKNLVDLIRQHPSNKEERNRLKAELYCLVIGGKFKQRNRNGLLKHSGLMVLDFDNYVEDHKESDDYKRLKECPEVVCIFDSPSGNGFKAFVRIPKCTVEDHTRYFRAFQQKHKFSNWDDGTSDVTRICYESFDQEAYVNIHAKEFNPELKDIESEIKISHTLANVNPHTTSKSNYSGEDDIFIPLTDEDKIIKLIMGFDFKTSFVNGQRHNHTLSLANVMCARGVSEQKASDYINANVNDGSSPKNDILEIVERAYKKKYLPFEPFNDYDKIRELKKEIRKDRDAFILNNDLDQDTLTKLIENIDKEFWTFYGKDKVKIDEDKLIDFLVKNGFCKYYPDGETKPELIRIVDGKIEYTSTDKMKDFILTHVCNIGVGLVRKHLLKKTNLFHIKFLDGVKTVTIPKMKPQANKEYIPYQNGLLQITPDGHKLIDYKEVKNFTWTNTILKRYYKTVENDDNDFKSFLYNVSGGNPLPFECVLGYLLTRFNDLGKAKVIILNDENLTSDKNGGTGKGLFAQAIRYILEVLFIDGKQHKISSEFTLGGVTENTNVIQWDDMRPDFDLEYLFSMITDGLSFRQLYGKGQRIEAEFSPKHLVIINHILGGKGHSFDRRRHDLVFKQYYGATRNLRDEFGHQLFIDWDEEHANRFDNYVVKCIQKFMKHGLVKQEDNSNVELRKFLANTSMEFYEYMSDDNVFLDLELSKNEEYNKFKQSYSDYATRLSQRTFTKWLQEYAKFKGLQYKDGVSSKNVRWFSLSEPKQSHKSGGKVVQLMNSKAKAKKQESNEDGEDIFDYLFESQQA